MAFPYPALFIDLSGVIYEGEQPLAGAAEAVARLRELGVMLRFVTNTATQSSQTITAKLAAFGIDLAADELFTAPIAARRYLQAAGLHPFCLVHPAISSEFAPLASTEPDAVVLGDAGDGLSYAALNQVFRLCKQGAPLIGIGMNRYFKDEHGLNLDAGPFIRAIEWAAGCTATIIGKPSGAFFTTVVASTPFAAAQCLMVGDDVDSDVAGAIRAGLAAALVRSGKYLASDEQRLPAGALVVDSLAALVSQYDAG